MKGWPPNTHPDIWRNGMQSRKRMPRCIWILHPRTGQRIRITIHRSDETLMQEALGKRFRVTRRKPKPRRM